ncbi:MAG: diguanylate cyclase [Arenimonas sp.]
MNENTTENLDRPDISPVMYRFMLYFLVVLAVFLAIGWPIYRQYLDARKNAVISYVNNYAEINEQLIQRQYRELYSDVRAFAVIPAMQRFAESRRTDDRVLVESFLSQAIGNYPAYGKIRVLDLDGNELLRVDNHDGRISVATRNQLANKANRYYFKSALRLRAGEVYASALDLNLENGRIERPYRPTQRLITPITSADGRVHALLMLNYDARTFLADFQTTLKAGGLATGMLLNQGGFWLSDSNPDNEWGWLLGHPERSFSARNPDLWFEMVSRARGQIRADQGVYLFRRIDPFTLSVEHPVQHGRGIAPESDDAHWHGVMVLFIPEESWLQRSMLRQLPGQLALVLIVLLLAVVSWIGAKLQVQKAAARAERARHMQEMEHQAHTDVLTGAFNRRHFYLFGERELSRARRIEDPLSLLMLDIDHFKRINDEYGHDIGDEALKLLTRTCLQQLRPHDLFARTGGEEFAALLPHTGIADAAMVAERIRRSVEALVLPVPDGREVRLTVSIGVVQWHAGDADLDALFKRADRKLYQAKDEGRDRVCA